MLQIDHAVIVHEMMHNLGVKHEQNRPDRDTCIDINWENIEVGYLEQQP